MTAQVLFIQGAGEGTHAHWDSKLVESLRSELGLDFAVRYPPMPNEGEPSYPEWKAVIEQELAVMADGVIVVGHSIGGTILIHALAEQPPERKIGAIVLLAAPFVGEGGWPSDGWEPQRDLGGQLQRGVPVFIFHGMADDTAPPLHAELFAREIPHGKLRLLPDRDHQFNNDLREVVAEIRSLPRVGNGVTR